MQPTRQTYAVDIAGLKRELPLFEVADGVRIAVLNVLGDTALVQAAATGLANKLAALDYSVLVTAEAKSIPLVHALSVATATNGTVWAATMASDAGPGALMIMMMMLIMMLMMLMMRMMIMMGGRSRGRRSWGRRSRDGAPGGGAPGDGVIPEVPVHE